MNKKVVAGITVAAVLGVAAFLYPLNRTEVENGGSKADPKVSSLKGGVRTVPPMNAKGDSVDFAGLINRLPLYEKPSNEVFLARHANDAKEFNAEKNLYQFYLRHSKRESKSEREKGLRVLQACSTSLWGVNGAPIYDPKVENSADPRVAAWEEMKKGCEDFRVLSPKDRAAALQDLGLTRRIAGDRIELSLRDLRAASGANRAGILAEFELLLSNTSVTVLEYVAQSLTNSKPQGDGQESILTDVKPLAFQSALCAIAPDCSAKQRFMIDVCHGFAWACEMDRVQFTRAVLMQRSAEHASQFDRMRIVYVEALQTQDWQTILELKP